MAGLLFPLCVDLFEYQAIVPGGWVLLDEARRAI
jgi:hypothetical protein